MSADRCDAPVGRSPAPGEPALDIDLYCLNCGYNLRGLSGDPIRCPECGDLNPVGEVEIPAAIITAQLRRMETVPGVCVGAILVGVALPLLGAGLAWAERKAATAGLVPCGVVPGVALAIVWGICVVVFRRSCFAKPGWVPALAKYHLYGLALGVFTCGLIGGGAWLAWRITDRYFEGPLFAAIFFASEGVWGVLVIMAAKPLIRRLHRRLAEILEPLQRAAAVTIAREETRRRLTRAGRGLLG